MIFYVITILLTFIATIVFYLYIINKPIVIKYHYSKIDWIFPVFFIIVSFLFSYLIDIIATNLLDNIHSDYSIFIWFKTFVSNGLLIPILCMINSIFFGLIIEFLKFDYLELYTNLVSKVCFSIMIVFASIKMIFVLLSDPQDVDVNFYISRSLMWILTVFGTWFGIGFRCEGRFIREKNKLLQKEKIEKYGKKAYFDFWLPIVLFMILGGIILVFIDVSSIVLFSFVIMFSFIAATIIMIIIYKLVFNPPIFISKNNIIKLLNKKKNKAHFCRFICTVDNELLKVKNCKVIYENHENDKDFKELFKDFTIPIEINDDIIDTEKIITELENRIKHQNNYIFAENYRCIAIQREKVSHK